jgi:hypothetical protein
MKRLLFVLVVISSSSLALVSGGASAQNVGTDAKPEMEMKCGRAQHECCLTKEGGSYIMMNADPKGPKRVAIVNNSVDLSARPRLIKESSCLTTWEALASAVLNVLDHCCAEVNADGMQILRFGKTAKAVPTVGAAHVRYGAIHSQPTAADRDSSG